MTANITARIAVNADDVSGTVSSAFADVTTQIQRNATEAGNAVTRTLDGVIGKSRSEILKLSRDFGQLANDAVSRGASNGNFSIDAAPIRAAAQAAREKAIALDQAAAAALRAGIADKNLSNDSRNLVIASQAAASSARVEADALEAKARALSLVETQMGGTAIATNRSVVAGTGLVRSAGEQRAGMQQLGFQINDVSAQLANGTSATVIFAQQSGQFVQAIQMMTGRTTGLLGALGGLPGMIGVTAISLAAMAYQNYKAGEAADAQGKKEDSLTERVRRQSEELRRNIQTQEQRNRLMLDDANREARNGYLAQPKLRNQIEALKDDIASNRPGTSTGGSGRPLVALRQELALAEATLASIVQRTTSATEDIRQLQGAAIKREIAGRLDPAIAETQRYERAVAKLDAQKLKGLGNDAYAAALLKEESLHKRNKDAIEASTKAEREASRGNLTPVTAREVRGALEDIGGIVTSGGRSASGNAKAGGAKRSYHLLNQAFDLGLVDAQGRPMTKARIRAELEAKGILIKELLGPGDKGHDDHFHVAYSTKRRSGEQITDGANRTAAADDRELASALTELRGRYDEAGEAAARYGETIAKIDALRSAGLIDEATAAEYRRAAAFEEVAAQANAAGDAFSRLDQLAPDVAKMLREAGPLVTPERSGEEAEKWAEAKIEAQKKADEDARNRITDLADFYEDAFNSGGKSIWGQFKAQGKRTLAELAAQLTLSLFSGSGQNSGLAGLLGGGNFGGLFGGGGSSGAFSQAGALGGLLGGFGGGSGTFGAAGGLIPGAGDVAKSAGGALSAAPAIGIALAALPILTSLLGGLTTKRGSATLSYSDGEFGSTNVRGNSSSRKQAAVGAVGSVGEALQQIADALGADVTGAGGVSVGVRKKTFVVDTTGGGRTKGSGVLRFDSEEAAIRAAISDVLSDGVITGISAASQKILRAGGKIEKAIEKAALIEAIPKLLKQRLDPLGAAIDDHNAKWAKTIAALEEGGASVEQIADAQKLYNLELVEIRENTKGASSAIKDYLQQFRVGGSSPFSLRTQLGNAESDLATQVSTIGTSGFDSEKFVTASQAVNDLKREIEGGTASYFDWLEQNKALAERAISSIDSAASNNTPDPFAALTAKSAEATASHTLATAELLVENNSYLRALIGKLDTYGAGTGAAFVGSLRSFA
jgi:hypothetical protein